MRVPEWTRPRIGIYFFFLVVVFLELGFFFEKQFVDHPALLKIGRDLAQCPMVFNVFAV